MCRNRTSSNSGHAADGKKEMRRFERDSNHKTLWLDMVMYGYAATTSRSSSYPEHENSCASKMSVADALNRQRAADICRQATTNPVVVDKALQASLWIGTLMVPPHP